MACRDLPNALPASVHSPVFCIPLPDFLRLSSWSTCPSQASFFSFPLAFALFGLPSLYPWAELGAKAFSLPSRWLPMTAWCCHGILDVFLTSRLGQCPPESALMEPCPFPCRAWRWHFALVSGICLSFPPGSKLCEDRELRLFVLIVDPQP